MSARRVHGPESGAGANTPAQQLPSFHKLPRLLRGDKGAMLAILAAVAALSTGLLLRNIALQSPVMSGDEYAYYASARMLRHLSDYTAKDPYLQRVGNPVFLAVGRVFFKISPNPESLMEALNALAFSSSVLLVCILMAWLTRNRFRRLAPVVIALLPFSAYSAHFMPESLYAFMFLAVAATLIWLLPKHQLLAPCLSGFLVAVLMLIKANGLSVLAAGLLTMLSLSVAPHQLRLSWKRTLISVGVFVIATYISEVAVHALIMGRLSWNPLLFIGQSYATNLQRGLNLSSYGPIAGGIVMNAVGHLITLLFVCAIPVAYFAAWLRWVFSRSAAYSLTQIRESRSVYVLVLFTLCATLTTLAMTLQSTAYVGTLHATELLRLHGRYYAFIFFLYFLGYFVLERRLPNRVTPSGGWRLWWFAGLIASILMIWIHQAFTIYPWDYPELVSASRWDGPLVPGIIIIMLGGAMYGAICWRPRLRGFLYPAFLCTLFVLSQFRVISWQFAQVNAFGPLSPQGRAMRDLLSEAERPRGVIIGADRYNRVAYFLFGFSSNAFVRQIPAGEDITADELPPDIDWIILLDDYDLKIPVESALDAGEVWLGWVTRAPAAAH